MSKSPQYPTPLPSGSIIIMGPSLPPTAGVPQPPSDRPEPARPENDQQPRTDESNERRH